MRIFVSLASYRDPVLPFTLERAAATAARPDRLHFGIVEQAAPGQPPLRTPGGVRASGIRLPSRDARGPCFARALAMSLYDGEEWFLQLDAHMDFDERWDERLVAAARMLGAPARLLVISSYPHGFTFEGGRAVHRPAPDGALVHVLQPGAAFAPDHPVLPFEAQPVATDVPVPGFHVGAGCLFAPGTIVQRLPYDPWYYFHGEEQALALRLFTHGWDIFHVPQLPLRHLYNNPDNGAPPRPLHWEEAEDAPRTVRRWELEERSRQRLAALVAGADLGAYGLGHVRTLAQYAAFSGIDYAARTLAPHAFCPRRAPLTARAA